MQQRVFVKLQAFRIPLFSGLMFVKYNTYVVGFKGNVKNVGLFKSRKSLEGGSLEIERFIL